MLICHDDATLLQVQNRFGDSNVYAKETNNGHYKMLHVKLVSCYRMQGASKQCSMTCLSVPAVINHNDCCFDLPFLAP